MNISKIIKNISNPDFFPIISSVLFCKKEILPTQKRIELAKDWLLSMQCQSGGLISKYSLLSGYGQEFPETTGYIIETILPFDKNSAIKAGDWLISVQNEDGSFFEESKTKKMVFDTAQTIFGMLALYNETKDQKYLQSAKKSADWIIAEQAENGSWIKYSFNNIPHSYYSRVSLALLRLWEQTKNEEYKNSAIKNLEWVLSQQQENGFFNNSSFDKSNIAPLHTIGYTIEGILKSYIILKEKNPEFSKELLCKAQKTIDRLITILRRDGMLHGFYNKNWEKKKIGKCLTGLAQICEILFILFQQSNEEKYLKNARKIIRYLKTKQITCPQKQILGSIPGTYPIWGSYMPMSLPNWSAKFFIDALKFDEVLKENYLSVAIFPNDPIESYLNKGETRIDYWNPNNTFKEIFVFNNSDYEFSKENIQELQSMGGNAKLNIIPIKSAEKYFQNYEIDIIRTYGVYAPGLLAKKLSQKYQIPLILSLHTNYDDYRETVVKKTGQYFKYIKQLIWKYFFEISIVKYAQKIIAVYDFAALYPRSLKVNENKINIIYNRVSPKKFFLDENISKRKKFTIINVNSLIAAKNQEILIKAMQYADFNLLLIGQGPEKKNLQDLAKNLRVQDRIEFISSVSNQELPKYYNQCHAYATIIKIGGIGIGVIEAMACALPIITSKLDIEKEPELLGFDNCVFVEHDEKDIAIKIQKLMDDQKYWQEMSQKSLDIYSQINGEKMSQKEKEIYLELI